VLVKPNVSVPHFGVEQLADGSTLFSVPNDGTHLAPANGPALPLVIRTLVLPDNVQINGVELIGMRSQPYPLPVTLARPQLETSNGDVITVTYALPGAYPENLFDYRVVKTDIGQELVLSVTPLQYDTQTHQATLYTEMDFRVLHQVAAPVPGPQFTVVTINDGAPLRTNTPGQSLHLEIAHNRSENANVMWTVAGPDGFVVASGNMVQHLINGVAIVNIPLDTTGWRPGPKDLAVYLVYDGRISDSENIPIVVEGLGIDELKPTHHIYAAENATALWQIAVRNETGALLPGLTEAIEVWVDDHPVAIAAQPGKPGEYIVQLSLDQVATGRHLVRIQVTDARGLTGWREWSLTKTAPASARVYLPVVLKGSTQ
jgi:hypothetical protein